MLCRIRWLKPIHIHLLFRIQTYTHTLALLQFNSSGVKSEIQNSLTKIINLKIPKNI
jgi:hypothetical protein